MVALARHDDQWHYLKNLGADPRYLDIDLSDDSVFAAAFADCDAVVFSAGGQWVLAGGDTPIADASAGALG